MELSFKKVSLPEELDKMINELLTITLTNFQILTIEIKSYQKFQKKVNLNLLQNL
jgi:hypothetical protein